MMMTMQRFLNEERGSVSLWNLFWLTSLSKRHEEAETRVLEMIAPPED